ncbi:MAG TPA: glycosyltransferase family 4 protein [Bryobacteraceae bacterium]|nr:glycosyltransferase family 4 protein [Bryobacteraceae bacterium]
MNILFLDQFGELGGAQRCLLDLFPALADRGWKAHLAAPAGGQLAECAARSGATVDPIRCGPFASGRKTAADLARFVQQTPRLAAEIRRLAGGYHADLIYVNGPRLLPAVALAARRGPPVLFHAHSFLDGTARRLAGRALLQARAGIVASCRFVAGPLLPYSGDRGVRVVYNGVREMRAARRAPPSAAVRIGMIGRISPEKGQADFLRAARILHPLMPECRFVICGAPLFSDPAAQRYGASLEALAADLPVEFTGWQDDAQSVLGTLDLLAVPSAAIDATPRVIMEAFACGVPVVAFASGGIPEMVEHDATGFLVAERNAHTLALAMCDALRDPQQLRRIAAAARDKARRDFSLDRYRRQLMDAIAAAVVPGAVY